MKNINRVFLFIAFAGTFCIHPIVGAANSANESFADSSDEIVRLQEILRSDSDNVKSHNDLGILFLKREQYQDAINEFKKALKIKPYYPIGPMFSGSVYTDAERYQEQIEKFQGVIQTNREYAKAHNNLGLVYLKLKMFDKARSEFDESIKIDPGSAKPHNNLGILYEKMGKGELAISKYNDALILEPDNATARFNLVLVKDSSKEQSTSMDSLTLASNEMEAKQEDLARETFHPADPGNSVEMRAELVSDESIGAAKESTDQNGSGTEKPRMTRMETFEREAVPASDFTRLESSSIDDTQLPDEAHEGELLEDTASEEIKILTVQADIKKKNGRGESIAEETVHEEALPSLAPEIQESDPLLGDWLFNMPK